MFGWLLRWFKTTELPPEPVVISTPKFGDLTLDEYRHWFRGSIEWNGQIIGLSIETDESLNVSIGIRTAESLSLSQAEWTREIDEVALRELFILKNEDWRNDDEAPISAEEFLRRIKPTSISVEIDGSFEFWYDDDFLFAGHAIQFCGTLADGITDAGL